MKNYAQPFSDFFKKGMQSLQEALAKQSLPSAKRMEAQERDERASRGQRCKHLIASEVWTLDLFPFLQEQSRILPWSPEQGPLTDEAVRNNYLLASGRFHGVQLVLQQVRAWIQDGEAAERDIAIEAKRQKERAESARILI